MLDAVMSFLPSPMDIDEVTGVNPETEEEEARKPESN